MSGLDDVRFVQIAKALADPTRLRIFEAVARDTPRCCGDVGRRLPVTAATVSHHLRILATAGLVETRRAGQQVHVRAIPETLAAYHAALGELVAALDASPWSTAPAPPGDRATPDADASPAARRARRLAQLDARYPRSDDRP